MQSPPTLAALARDRARGRVCFTWVRKRGDVFSASQKARRVRGSSPDATSKQNLFDAPGGRFPGVAPRQPLAAARRASRERSRRCWTEPSPGASCFRSEACFELERRGASFAAEEEKRVRLVPATHVRKSRSTSAFGRDIQAPGRSAPPTRRLRRTARKGRALRLARTCSWLCSRRFSGRPETGAVKTVAADAAAAVDGGSRRLSAPAADLSPYAAGPTSHRRQEEDQYSRRRRSPRRRWSRPAYAFAERFYGARSLPAARAAWCVAEGRARWKDSDATARARAPLGRLRAETLFGPCSTRPRAPPAVRARAPRAAVAAGARCDRAPRSAARTAAARDVRRCGSRFRARSAARGGARARQARGARVRRRGAPLAAEAERAAAIVERRVRRAKTRVVSATRKARVRSERPDLARGASTRARLIEHVRLGVETSVAAAERRRAPSRFARAEPRRLPLLARDDGAQATRAR